MVYSMQPRDHTSVSRPCGDRIATSLLKDIDTHYRYSLMLDLLTDLMILQILSIFLKKKKEKEKKER